MTNPQKEIDQLKNRLRAELRAQTERSAEAMRSTVEKYEDAMAAHLKQAGARPSFTKTKILVEGGDSTFGVKVQLGMYLVAWKLWDKLL